MKRFLNALVWVGVFFLLHGCAWQAEEIVIPPSNKVTADSDSRNNALINIELDSVTAEASDISGVELQELRKDYVELMPLIDELSQQQNTELTWQGVLSQEIRNRLADIEMLIAEEAQADGTTLTEGTNYYTVAIRAYQQLLAESEQSATPLQPIAKENLLYQLARAFSLQGEDEQSLVYGNQLLREFPFSEFVSELQFRQGEFYYNQNDYPAAIRAYRKVIDGAFDPYALDGQRKVDTEDPFYSMSAYMLGWSHFKREEYAKSIDAFALMLDASLLPDDYTQNYKPIVSLALSQQKLVEDALDMMALMFAAEGGAFAINAYYAVEGDKPYAYLVYDALAQQFLDDSRYRDSADTFLAFANRYPTSPQAVTFFIKHIDAFIIGNFPAEVLPAKQRFVESYGLNGANWQGYTAKQTIQAFPYLEQYLKELAQFEHALAQQADELIDELPLDDNSAEITEQRIQTVQTRDNAFLLAQRWYREYIATFGPSEHTADMQFYLAESLFENEQYDLAAEEFKLFAYTYINHPEAANAAYSVLLSYSQLNAAAEQMGGFTPLQQSQIDFLSHFAQDYRATDIAIALSQGLFDDQLYFDAVTWSKWILERPLDPSDTKTARLVLAQSQFELNDFAGAQVVFQQLLANLDITDPLEIELSEKLAATYYQQAQQALKLAPADTGIGIKLSAQQANALRAGVERLMQVITELPDSAIALNARYDAAAYLLQLSDWQPAIALLIDFEQRYPTHELTKGIDEKLIIAYEKSEQWLLASERLMAIWEANKDTEVGREALYIAADYADRSGNIDIALSHYRNYAHSYPTPLMFANEARHKLSNYYLDRKEPQKRRFWLKKLISAYSENIAQADDRARYLAAFSATVFADDDYQAFSQIKLTLPLSASIKAKREAMQKVLSANQQIINYRVAEFTTKAGFRLGQAYASLADALYESERPNDLDALALEQYDILLEEQAFPFEEQAIEVHITNTRRSWQGNYDQWVAKSFESLAKLLPARFNKPEHLSEVDYVAF